MKRLTAPLLALAVAGMLAGAPSTAATIVIEPASPGPADSVHVTITSRYSMMCWTSLGTQCPIDPADTLRVTAQTQYCNGDPDCPCPMMMMALVRRCDFGPMAPGDYVVSFTEIHVNPDDPFATSTETQAFTVASPTPALHRTWGALKSVYR